MRKPTLVALAIVAAALFGGACKEDEPRPPVAANEPASPGVGASGGGGGTRDASIADGGADAADGGACTDLAVGGGLIDQLAVNDDPPRGSGGTIVDGVYDLTDVRVYQGAAGLPGPTGTSYQGSIRITGTTFERVLVFQTSAGPSTEIRSSGTFTANATNATIALSCPTASQEQVTYSVTDSSVAFTNLVTKESFTFVRQP